MGGPVPPTVPDALRAELRGALTLLRADPTAGEAAIAALEARAGASRLHALGVAHLRATQAFLGGRYADAERASRQLLERAEALEQPLFAADAAVLLGNIELERGEYEEATRWYTRAAATAERSGDPGDLGRIHNNLGLVAWRTRDLARAEEHFDRALRLYGPDADPRIVGNLHNNLGLVYEDSGDTSAAEAAWRRAVALLADAGDPNYHANALSNLGELLESRGQLEDAAALQEQALALRLGIQHARGVVSSRVALARIALARRENAAAETQVGEALALARAMGLQKQQADALSLNARLLERQGRYPEALQAEREVSALRERVFGEQMTERVAALQLKFDAWQARTEARHAANENARLQVALEEAARAAAVRDRFLATLSHELHTPLTAALGAAELLRAGAPDERQARLSEVVIAASTILRGVIADLLVLSRDDGAPLELRAEPLHPRQVGEQLVAVVADSAAARGLALRLEVAPEVPAVVLGDAARLGQLLLNLLVNAVKFTERGSVLLRVSGRGSPLRIEVEDTGVGIAPEQAATLFQPFRHADDPTTRRHGGPGVGLAICRRIVDAMGGRIEMESQPGRGTRFTVTLPLPAAAPETEAVPAAPPAGRVLLVEDDDAVREVLAEVLAWCGVEVTAVASGAEALDRYRPDRFDLVVLDICMPGMDGYTCGRRLRQQHGDVRILGLSGAATGEEARRAAEAGFAGWLSKPASAQAIRDALLRLGLGRPDGAAPAAHR